MTSQRHMRPMPVADFLDDGDLARIFAAHEERLDREPTPAPPEDPAELRRRRLSDRAQALLAGRFGLVEVELVRDDALVETPALDHARAFLAQRDKPVLVLLGGPGAGKTTAATWIASEVGGARPGLVMSTTMERRGRYDHEFSAWLDDRTMIVVDDLGVEPIDGKGYFAALVDELINEATRNRRRMVITTNADTSTMRDRIGDRAASRLAKFGMVAACGNRDIRRAR